MIELKTMTAKELIEKLKEYPEDIPVLTHVYNNKESSCSLDEYDIMPALPLPLDVKVNGKVQICIIIRTKEI